MKEQAERREEGGGSGDGESTPGRRKGTWDVRNATKEEADALFDRMCNGRNYEGPRWWEDPEAHGYKVYRGPGK